MTLQGLTGLAADAVECLLPEGFTERTGVISQWMIEPTKNGRYPSVYPIYYLKANYIKDNKEVNTLYSVIPGKIGHVPDPEDSLTWVETEGALLVEIKVLLPNAMWAKMFCMKIATGVVNGMLPLMGDDKAKIQKKWETVIHLSVDHALGLTDHSLEQKPINPKEQN